MRYTEFPLIVTQEYSAPIEEYPEFTSLHVEEEVKIHKTGAQRHVLS